MSRARQGTFKVGDRVELVHGDKYPGLRVGDQGTVTQLWDNGKHPRIHFDTPRDGYGNEGRGLFSWRLALVADSKPEIYEEWFK